MNDYDVIVVGAGPGGSSAALFAARAGLKTLLIDKSEFPRDKICGDAISGKSINILRKLELFNEIENIPQTRANGVIFSSPNGESIAIKFRSSTPGEYINGYVCKRIDYDNFLFRTARSEVALCLERFNSTEIIRNGNGFISLKGSLATDKQPREFRAKIIIGADGYKSFIARQLGLYKYDTKHTLVALRAYFEGVSNMSDHIEIHFLKESLPGYFWIFPLNGNQANVGIGMRHYDIKKRNIDLFQVLENILRSPVFGPRFENAVLTEKIKGWNLPTGSIFRPNYADNVLLIGDAAGLIDPFTGEGIGNAMTSAEIAAAVAAEAIENGKTDSSFLCRYHERLKTSIGNELSLSYKLQKIGTHYPFLLNLVIGKTAKNQNVAEWISAMIADEIPKRDLTNPLTYLKLLWS